MLDYNDLVVSIKKAAMDAVSASKQTAVVFGKVIGTSPLAISIDQKLMLTDTNLVLSRSVTDFQMDVTGNHETDSASGGSGDDAFASHKHGYTGRKTMTVHNALRLGETVIMVQMQGGQKFIVLDRVMK